MNSELFPIIKNPPLYCDYAKGKCDQEFAAQRDIDVLFLYASTPKIHTEILQTSATQLGQVLGSQYSITWKQIPVTGQILFCEICKSIRFSKVVVVDVTHLNSNVLFELGFALGLGLTVLPIRDTSFTSARTEVDSLGILNTLGYIDFHNAEQLTEKLAIAVRQAHPIGFSPRSQDPKALYLVKSALDVEGQVRLVRLIKKSRIGFRMFDPTETPSISITDVLREVSAARAVICHFLTPERSEAQVNNCRGAIFAGVALAGGKRTLLLQEGETVQPLDFRDISQNYLNFERDIPRIVDPLLGDLLEDIQTRPQKPQPIPSSRLELVDLGDVAAENEIVLLRSYFVPTAQFNDTKRGHARLVVGRKGSGKTAIFYSVREAFWRSKSFVVLDLKPEGHQFKKLRQVVLTGLESGFQEHLMVAFWYYLLLMEIAIKLTSTLDRNWLSGRGLVDNFDELCQVTGMGYSSEQADFTERLFQLIERLIDRWQMHSGDLTSSAITELIYENDIDKLQELLIPLLSEKECVWLLIDNIDKGWPVEGTTPQDITILQALLEATRKIQRHLVKKGIELRTVVFIRNDIYSLVLRHVDRGKDGVAIVDWNDPQAFKALLHRRLQFSLGSESDFETLWAEFFPSTIAGEDSFRYLLDRTLMRPRDLLRIIRECINTAVNRGHCVITEDDVLQAEISYSEHLFNELCSELHDIETALEDIPYVFHRSCYRLTEDDLTRILASRSIKGALKERLLRLFLWFGFLGIIDRSGKELYAYMYQYGVERMVKSAGDFSYYVLHPAYRAALDTHD